MAKYRLKKQLRLKPEVKEKLDAKKEKALSIDNLTRIGCYTTIASGAAGIALKVVKIKKELK